jgi:hypothetical protein
MSGSVIRTYITGVYFGYDLVIRLVGNSGRNLLSINIATVSKLIKLPSA